MTEVEILAALRAAYDRLEAYKVYTFGPLNVELVQQTYDEIWGLQEQLDQLSNEERN